MQFTTNSGASIIFIFFTIFHCIDSQAPYIAHTFAMEVDGALAAKKCCFPLVPGRRRFQFGRGFEAAKAVGFGIFLRNRCKRDLTQAHAGVRRIPWAVKPA